MGLPCMGQPWMGSADMAVWQSQSKPTLLLVLWESVCHNAGELSGGDWTGTKWGGGAPAESTRVKWLPAPGTCHVAAGIVTSAPYIMKQDHSWRVRAITPPPPQHYTTGVDQGYERDPDPFSSPAHKASDHKLFLFPPIPHSLHPSLLLP